MFVTLYKLLNPLIIVIIALMLAACDSASGSSPKKPELENHAVQWGAANPTYLSATATVSEAIDPSGVGIGGSTDGEIVVLNGKVLGTDSSGVVSELGLDETLVIAAVVSNFKATVTNTTTETLNCQDDLDDYLNDLIGEQAEERIAAVAISGNFSSVDYVVIYGVSAESPIYNVENVSATLVGVKVPYYFGDDSWEINGITVGVGEFPYHYHFVTDDETVLGHIRDCDIDAGSEIEIGLVNIYDLRMNYSDN